MIGMMKGLTGKAAVFEFRHEFFIGHDFTRGRLDLLPLWLPLTVGFAVVSVSRWLALESKCSS